MVETVGNGRLSTRKTLRVGFRLDLWRYNWYRNKFSFEFFVRAGLSPFIKKLDNKSFVKRIYKNIQKYLELFLPINCYKCDKFVFDR